MHPIGKFIIMVAVVILVIMVFLNYSGLSGTASSDRYRSVTERNREMADESNQTRESAPSLDLPSLLSGQGSRAKFDLDGPLVCDYKDKEATVKIRVLSKNILVTYAQLQSESGKPHNVLVNDGVLYMWDQGSYEGKKVSGVGQYLSLLDSFSAFITPDMILSMLPQQDGKKLSSQQVSALKDSCSDKQVDATIFGVPKAVKFVETDLQKLQVADDMIIN